MIISMPMQDQATFLQFADLIARRWRHLGDIWRRNREMEIYSWSWRDTRGTWDVEEIVYGSHTAVLDSFRPFLSREFVPERTFDFSEGVGTRKMKREGKREAPPPAGHSGRYLDRTVNADSEGEECLDGMRTHQWGSIQFRFWCYRRVVFGPGTSILVPLIIFKMEMPCRVLARFSCPAIFDHQDVPAADARASRPVGR